MAAGAILHYVKTTQPGECQHIRGIRAYRRGDSLQLDSVTLRNLELVEPLSGSQDSSTTLFATLNACQTAMGKRMLKANILRPLLDAAVITQRLDSVAELHGDLLRRETIRDVLAEILDLERLLARIALESRGLTAVNLAAVVGRFGNDRGP